MTIVPLCSEGNSIAVRQLEYVRDKFPSIVSEMQYIVKRHPLGVCCHTCSLLLFCIYQFQYVHFIYCSM